MKDIQKIIDTFPDVTKEDMEKRYQEYKKLIEKEFEMQDNCTTLLISIVPPCATMKPIDLPINKLNKEI